MVEENNSFNNNEEQELESMGLPADYENPNYCVYAVAVLHFVVLLCTCNTFVDLIVY